LLGILPITNAEGRGEIPEVEICYEMFGAKALTIAEKSLNLTRIVKAARPLDPTGFDYEDFVEKFKKALIEGL